MKRWSPLCWLVAILAQPAHADEVRLRIAPLEPEWLLPPLICRSSSISIPVCRAAGEASPDAASFSRVPQVQPEGIPLPVEEQILIDITPLVAAGEYEAVLVRVRTIYGVGIDLIEAGDSEGFLRTIRPADGSRLMGPPPAPERPTERPMDRGELNMARDIRQLAGGAQNARRPGARPGAEADADVVAPDFMSASMLYVLGHSYFSLQQYLAAETAFELALVALPNHVRVHESLGMLYLQTDRRADAREHLARAVQLGRNTAHVHAALGYLDEKMHRYSAAASAFQRALALEPDNRSAQRGLLHALTESREHAKARVLVEQLLSDAPDDPDLWRYRAKIALGADDRAAALASLETAFRLGDDSIENRHALAVLHLTSSNIARAVDLLQGSARGLAFPLVEQALDWLENENEWDDFRALSTSVDRAALGGAEQSRLLARRASLALHDRNRRAASTALQEALALDPSNAEALMALGEIYRGDRDYGRADLLFQRASAYAPVRESALVARAAVAIDQENFDGALAFLGNAVAGNPARADLRRNIDLLENLLLLRTQR